MANVGMTAIWFIKNVKNEIISEKLSPWLLDLEVSSEKRGNVSTAPDVLMCIFILNF